MTDTFWVEGRYFPNSLQAFTFAGILADRMDRPVHVHAHGKPEFPLEYKGANWISTAHPEGFIRPHLVKQPPGVL